MAFSRKVPALAWVLLLATLHVAIARKLPPFVHTCKRTDPQLNQCLKNSVEELRPYLRKGIPEMRIPPLEPFKVQYVALDSGESFKAEFRDLKVYGVSDFTLKNVDFDLDNNKAQIDLLFPKLRILSVYSVKGRILILQLNGHGNADGNYTNLEGYGTVTGKREFRKGKEYIKFDKIDLEVKLGKTDLFFEDLFPGNPEITAQTNRIISENILDIFTELKPILHDTIGKFILQLVHDVFNRFTLDDLFPKD